MNPYKIKQTISIALLLIIMAMAPACTERISISTEDAPEHLVIYGYLTNDTTAHSIRITRSAGYFATTTPVGVSNAIVEITSDDTIIRLIEKDGEPGLYQTPPDIFGEEGKSYSLYVSVDADGDGVAEEFEADTYMPYASTVDSIQLQQSEVFDDEIEILLYGKIGDNERNYFSFHAYRNQTIVNDSLVGFFIIDDEYIEKKELNGLSCFYLDQEDDRSRLTYGDTVTLRVDILPKDYADFLENAQDQVDGSNPIFGGPPANVETNIRSIVNTNAIPIVGFFSAFTGTQASTVYRE